VNTLLPTTLHDGIEIALVLGVLQLPLVALLFRQTRLRAKAEDVAAKSQERLALISSMSGFGFGVGMPNRADRGAAFHFTLPVPEPISEGKKNHEQHSEVSVYC
jgi:hypothetical protein